MARYDAGMPQAAVELPIYMLAQPEGRAAYRARLARLSSTAQHAGEAADTVDQVIRDVAERGDDAVIEAMQRWTDPGFSAEDIVVDPAMFEPACHALDPELRESLQRAIEQVRAYQQHVMPSDPEPVRIGGAELGLRHTAVDSAGLYVPGGSAVLFSTLIMLAVPALVAGVPAEQLAVVHPPPTRRSDTDAPRAEISPVVLATCHLLGLSRLYRLGGAQAVAALAFGTERVEPVDLIAGPGNVFVQLAKARVAGRCGTDGGFYGPSEIVTLADGSADPKRVASDLLAQAEHDPGKCFLVAWDRSVIDGVLAALGPQLAALSRREAIERALLADSCAVCCGDEDEAIRVVNELATEHLNLAVADPSSVLPKVRHAGEVFLGDATPVAAGDYYAGPSHCLPTGTTARFTSGISVYTFLKRTGTVAYPQGMPPQAIADVARLAEAEGLTAHAASAQTRRT